MLRRQVYQMTPGLAGPIIVTGTTPQEKITSLLSNPNITNSFEINNTKLVSGQTVTQYKFTVNGETYKIRVSGADGKEISIHKAERGFRGRGAGPALGWSDVDSILQFVASKVDVAINISSQQPPAARVGEGNYDHLRREAWVGDSVSVQGEYNHLSDQDRAQNLKTGSETVPVPGRASPGRASVAKGQPPSRVDSYEEPAAVAESLYVEGFIGAPPSGGTNTGYDVPSKATLRQAEGPYDEPLGANKEQLLNLYNLIKAAQLVPQPTLQLAGAGAEEESSSDIQPAQSSAQQESAYASPTVKIREAYIINGKEITFEVQKQSGKAVGVESLTGDYQQALQDVNSLLLRLRLREFALESGSFGEEFKVDRTGIRDNGGFVKLSFRKDSQEFSYEITLKLDEPIEVKDENGNLISDPAVIAQILQDAHKARKDCVAQQTAMLERLLDPNSEAVQVYPEYDSPNAEMLSNPYFSVRKEGALFNVYTPQGKVFMSFDMVTGKVLKGDEVSTFEEFQQSLQRAKENVARLNALSASINKPGFPAANKIAIIKAGNPPTTTYYYKIPITVTEEQSSQIPADRIQTDQDGQKYIILSSKGEDQPLRIVGRDTGVNVDFTAEIIRKTKFTEGNIFKDHSVSLGVLERDVVMARAQAAEVAVQAAQAAEVAQGVSPVSASSVTPASPPEELYVNSQEARQEAAAEEQKRKVATTQRELQEWRAKSAEYNNEIEVITELTLRNVNRIFDFMGVEERDGFRQCEISRYKQGEVIVREILYLSKEQVYKATYKSDSQQPTETYTTAQDLENLKNAAYNYLHSNQFGRIGEEGSEYVPAQQTGSVAYNKSRYLNIGVKEETAVKLAGAEFTHANYVTIGQSASPQYILAQGPIDPAKMQGRPETRGDMLQMLLEQRASSLFCASELQEGSSYKFSNYLPKVGQEFEFQGYKIKRLSKQEFGENGVDADGKPKPYLEYSIIEITDQSGQKHTMPHFWVRHMPDHDTVESQTFLELMAFAKGFEEKFWEGKGQPGPCVAHCSAGVGRSSLCVATQHILKGTEQSADEIFADLRTCRDKAVQTSGQLKMIGDIRGMVPSPSQMQAQDATLVAAESPYVNQEQINAQAVKISQLTELGKNKASEELGKLQAANIFEKLQNLPKIIDSEALNQIRAGQQSIVRFTLAGSESDFFLVDVSSVEGINLEYTKKIGERPFMLIKASDSPSNSPAPGEEQSPKKQFFIAKGSSININQSNQISVLGGRDSFVAAGASPLNLSGEARIGEAPNLEKIAEVLQRVLPPRAPAQSVASASASALAAAQELRGGRDFSQA